MESSELKKIIEALLFASEKPIAVEQMKEVIEEVETKDIRAALVELMTEYETLGRSFKVYEVAGGYQMVTAPEFADYLKKFYRVKSKDKLSKPALETLAVIAYRQPITKSEIEDIRGVNVDGVVETLADRMMIRITGRKDAPGRPILYGTTKEFLDRFGLSSLNELPKLGEFTEADIDVNELKQGLAKEGIEGTESQEVNDGTGEVAQADRPAGLETGQPAEPEGEPKPEDRPPEGESK
ncbi:MAG: SMC-Scp complex subunit ScpB [Candidatus Omnitrophica bacterium]|nr:SMC-Scp complex subunit ScpB [Candidatus Omnitrophota bacterium]MDD5311279.1 SMC-Scp complex subunit ScpB [Candidatus Omnitrophota bacterium]MDD5546845.1 SMC-Scp complex subunit ScpB [Candidatus Omnitrophota bacterium]